MSRRGDHIHKRKDGRWEGRYKQGIKEDGTISYRSVYGKTYTECKNKLEEYSTKTILPDTKYKEYKFSEVLINWLNANRIRLKGSTVSKYLYMIESHILPELGNRRVSSITSSVVNEFLENKLKAGQINGIGGLSAAYVKTIAIIIEAALKYANSEGMCPQLKNPIYKPSVLKKELNVLTRDEQENFEKMLMTEKNEVSLGTIIALYTGMRIGEVCALT